MLKWSKSITLEQLNLTECHSHMSYMYVCFWWKLQKQSAKLSSLQKHYLLLARVDSWEWWGGGHFCWLILKPWRNWRWGRSLQLWKHATHKLYLIVLTFLFSFTLIIPPFHTQCCYRNSSHSYFNKFHYNINKNSKLLQNLEICSVRDLQTYNSKW